MKVREKPKWYSRMDNPETLYTCFNFTFGQRKCINPGNGMSHWYCLSFFELRLLITTLVSSNCICKEEVAWFGFSTSGTNFCTFGPLVSTRIVLNSLTLIWSIIMTMNIALKCQKTSLFRGEDLSLHVENDDISIMQNKNDNCWRNSF